MTKVSTHHDHNRPLNRQDYKTLSLAALGGALEFYDFIIFVFFAVVIGELFFPADIPEWLRQFQTFGIFAAGYLARPLGGIIMAHFGDLIGRKRMFTLSIILMALPTLLIGLLPTYASLGIAAFKELEQTLGVLFFLKGGFHKNFLHQHKAVIFGPSGKVVVAVARLRFTSKGCKNIFFRLAAFQRLHSVFSLKWMLVVRLCAAENQGAHFNALYNHLP